MYLAEHHAFLAPALSKTRCLWVAARKSAWVFLSVFCFAAPTFGDCNISLRWDDDPPYFMEQEGEVVGIDVDLVSEAAERIGCSLTLEKLPWARALRELRTGRVDMLSGAYRTPEREEFAHYSNVEALVSPNILFIRQSDKADFGFTGLRDLLASDFRLGAQIDVAYSDEYSTLIQDPAYTKNIEYSSSRESLWNMLARNRIDGVIASRLTGLYEIRELGLSDVITPTSFTVSNKPAYFIFSKQSVSQEFVEDFDRVLRSMLDDGTFSEIVNRHVCTPGGPSDGADEKDQGTGTCQSGPSNGRPGSAPGTSVTPQQ